MALGLKNRKMQVTIVGCVKKPGKLSVSKFSNVGKVIEQAGGFRVEKFLFPSGLITIRSQRKWKSKRIRNLGNSDFVRKRIDFKKKRKNLYREYVHEGEHIIVQFGGLGLSWWYGQNTKMLKP